ncbi:Fe-S cluster assembly protein SufD [Furfurilactobacillus milii]|uniref:Fe-S cluster assembly protein SufD n=1 Tax=Furfurilactobacillus milii TaxID=2888272 RepID=A0A6N9HZ01_9LACO|nr:Fe-S cluster assembly protein SufD [Furfurilactobacillus milii]MYV16092.1 Fe-S cluster assembly protein SufD [Furfurilactobacillus milii]
MSQETMPLVADTVTKHDEPAWMIDKRRAAMDQMPTLKMPRVQRFDYRYWQMMPSTEIHWQSSSASLAQSDLDTTTAKADDQQISIVQVGQTTTQVKLPAELGQQGVLVMDLFDAMREYPELVKPHLMTNVIKTNETKLTSYHMAMLTSGIFVYVPRGVAVNQPIEAHIIQDSTKTDHPLISHVLIVAEAGSEFAFTQHLSTVGEAANIANCFVEIDAAEDSRVRFSSLDAFGPKTVTYFERRGLAANHANIDWAVGLLNDGNTIGNIDTNLLGEGAETDSKMIAITDGTARMGINNGVTNRGKHSVGNILQRGVLLGRSQLVFNGIGDIIHGASGAKAEQENRLLMMSNEARGNANPILLIDENDVLAGHAASVGQVDQQQLYYLMSRGIDRQQAQRLVIRGFLGVVLSAIPAKTVRQELITTIERKLTDEN